MATPAIHAELARRQMGPFQFQDTNPYQNLSPYNTDMIDRMRSDSIQAMGGNVANPWLVALMAMRQAKGNPNWQPGADDPEYRELSADIAGYQPGMRELPSAIKREQAARTDYNQRYDTAKAKYGEQFDTLVRGLESVDSTNSPGETGAGSSPETSDQSLAGRLTLAEAQQNQNTLAGLTNPNSLALNALSLLSSLFSNINPIAIISSLAQLHNSGSKTLGFTGLSQSQAGKAHTAMTNTPAFQSFRASERNPTVALPDEDSSAVGPPAGAISPPDVTGLSSVEMDTAIATDQPTADVPDTGSNAPTTGSTSQGTAPPGVPATGPNTAPGDIGNPGGGAVGAPGDGPSGTGSPGTGDGGAPGAPGQAKKGGITKGKKNQLSSTKVHGQEFVMNANATKAFKPMLRAMNQLVPYKDKYANEPFDSLFDRAHKLLRGEEA